MSGSSFFQRIFGEKEKSEAEIPLAPGPPIQQSIKVGTPARFKGDFTYMAEAYGTTPGHPEWNPFVDYLWEEEDPANWEITIFDVLAVTWNYGTQWKD